MRAILLAIALCLAPGLVLAQPEASPATVTSPAEEARDEAPADLPADPPQMKNAGELRMGSVIMETFPLTPPILFVGILALVALTALHDRTARSTARRVPLGPMLAEAWRFQGRYWRRAPGPALFVIPVSAAIVSTFLKEQGFLTLLGLAGVFLLMVMAMAAAARLAGQDLEPDRTDLALGPFGIQFGAVERRMLEAMLLSIGIGLAANLALSWIERLVNHTQSVPAMAVFMALSSFALIYVYGRLMLFVPRAGLDRGISLPKSWRLTRAALLPLAVVFLLPQALAVLLMSALHMALPGNLDGTPFGPAEAILMLIYLAISPFGWGAQIAMVRSLEPDPKA